MIEGDPYSLIEAMTIAAYATGCEHGYVYLRGEYPQAHAHPRARRSTRRARRGYLGDDVLGEGFAFDIEIRKGGGAYICGEETAIFNSIEGFRGEPRNKPPFPVGRRPVRQADGGQQRRDARQRAAIVLERAGRRFAATGTEGVDAARSCSASPATSSARASTRCRSARRWRELLDAGRRRGRRAGAAGRAAGRRRGRLRAARRARPAAHVRGRARGQDDARLGRRAGARRHASTCRASCMRIAAFFRNESCGQCVPCRVGTVRQQEALARLVSGRTRGGAGAELALSPRSASACATPRSAVSARPRRARSSPPSGASASSEVRMSSSAAGAAEAHGRARGRRAAGARVRGPDDPRRAAQARRRDADALLRRHAAARERLPRLRGRDRGRARARAVVLAQGRGRA